MRNEPIIEGGVDPPLLLALEPFPPKAERRGAVIEDECLTHTVTVQYLDRILNENARLEDQCTRFADRLNAMELVLTRREHQMRIMYTAYKGLKKLIAEERKRQFALESIGEEAGGGGGSSSSSSDEEKPPFLLKRSISVGQLKLKP